MKTKTVAGLSGMRFIFIIFFFLGSANAFCATINVSSISQLTAAIANANPGDVIILKNGVYTTSGSIGITRSGTAEQPIMITAETIGGVEIKGSAGFVLNSPSAYIIIHGFKFTHNGRMVMNLGTHHCRITRNVFQNAGTSTDYLWVQGLDHEIDYNTFQNKTSAGPMIRIDAGSRDHKGTQRSHLHHNFFFNHGFTGGNGGEAIQCFGGFAKVEYNLFEKCDGDPEIITIKASDAVYRYNTFRDASRGQLVLRYCNRVTIEGNFLINTKGLRAYGSDNKIINNYFENNKGTAIMVSNGAYGYLQSKRMLIAFNTMIDDGITGRSGDTPPTDITIANNIMVKNSGTSINESTPYVNPKYEGNILWGNANIGSIPSSGYTKTDPLLVRDGDGIYHLSSASPAINASVGTYNVAEDIDGQVRNTSDVGSDEFSGERITRKLLKRTDVGPQAGLDPSVFIISPGAGATYTAPASIDIQATASDSVNGVTKVEFYSGSTKIGEDITSPYSFSWANVTAGTYIVTVKSINGNGDVLSSTAVTVIVRPPQTPYLGIVRSIPGKIEAEDFDEGGQGVAYNETTAGNNYNVYRFDNVDIQPCGDAGGGFNLALFATGEWVEYTVNVEVGGTYKLDLRLAATATGRALHVEMDGVDITGKVAVPNTGNFQVYKTVSIITPVLTPGQKIMRVFFETSSHNLNWLTFTVQRRTQSVTFESIEDITYGDPPFKVIASADSGLPVSLEVVSGPAMFEGEFLKITGAGEVSLRASQAGSEDYFPASAEETFTVEKAEQVITFKTIETKTYGDIPFDLEATVNSGLPLSIEIVSGPATLSGSTVTITGAGDVTIRVGQEGNENYLPASVEQTFTINKAAQSIAFSDITPKHTSDTVELFATSSSGLEVSFEIIEGPGILAGNTLTFTGQGEVIVQASQAGNENFLAADDVEQSILVFADDAKKDGLLLIVNPNPTKGKVKVKMENKKDKEYSFVVYDRFGQVVESSIIEKSHKMFEIDLEREEKGIYYLWVTDGTDIWVRRIIRG